MGGRDEGEAGDERVASMARRECGSKKGQGDILCWGFDLDKMKKKKKKKKKTPT